MAKDGKFSCVTGALPGRALVSAISPRRGGVGKRYGSCEMVEPGTSGSFVVRIWLEGEPGNNPIWRGHIQHVQGEEDRYFQDLREMQAFLEQISGVPWPAPDRVETDSP
jgi:hypothetical protein